MVVSARRGGGGVSSSKGIFRARFVGGRRGFGWVRRGLGREREIVALGGGSVVARDSNVFGSTRELAVARDTVQLWDLGGYGGHFLGGTAGR